MMKNASLLFLVLLVAPRAIGDVHHGVPPDDLWGFEKSTQALTYSNGVEGYIEFNGSLKKLYCIWRLGENAIRTQEISTSYYPTGVLALAPTKWLIAGKTTRGATVIELWTVQKPNVLYEQNSNAPPSIQNATVTQIDTVYDEATEGRDMVMNMTRKLGESNTNVVLVHFYDSKDIYELDLTTQVYTLVASPTVVTSGVLHASQIDAVWEEFWSGEHLTRGYVYVMASPGTSQDPVILEDSDRDGDLDLYVLSTYAVWASTYADESNYVQ